MHNKGTIKTWKEDKGFGFIKPDDGDKDIFAHISEFGRIPRKPRAGDKVSYQIMRDKDGKVKAGNIYIEGVERVAAPVSSNPGQRRNKTHQPARNRFVTGLASMLVTFGLAALIYYWQINTSPKTTVNNPNARTPVFTCSGKQYCSEMNSCEEAKYYLKHCPDTKMDGDRDGIPCEQQWCN